MKLQEWREKQAAAVTLTLPSGLEILARRPGPLQVAMWDRLPLLLTTFEGHAEGLSKEQLAEAAAFTRELFEYCWVAPKLQEEISPREIPNEDFGFVMAWALRMKEAAALRPFRGERADAGGDGDSQAVFREAIGADGDRRSSAGAGVRPGGDGTGDAPEARG
jgi:hypothetical protein